MNKIINGKKYDTETAKMVGHYVYGDYEDYTYLDEKLYQKKTGEFFIHGYGGVMTKYRIKIAEDTFSGSTCIIPYSIEEAKEWVMEHMDGDDYEELFGPVEE